MLLISVARFFSNLEKVINKFSIQEHEIYNMNETRTTTVQEVVSGRTGALYASSKDAWTNDELFLTWLQHFSKHA